MTDSLPDSVADWFKSAWPGFVDVQESRVRLDDTLHNLGVKLTITVDSISPNLDMGYVIYDIDGLGRTHAADLEVDSPLRLALEAHDSVLLSWLSGGSCV